MKKNESIFNIDEIIAQIEAKRNNKESFMSIEHMANLLGLSDSSYKRYIKGEAGPLQSSFETVYRICEYLEKPLYQLTNLDYNDNPFFNTVDMVYKLSEPELMILNSFIKANSHQINQNNSILFDSNFMESACLITAFFHKILKVNLTKDTYECLRVSNDVWALEVEKLETKKISDWFNWFIDNDFVHPDDIEIFKNYANVSAIKQIMRFTDKDSHLKYRRKIEDSFTYVNMDVIKCPDYTNANETILLCIRNSD